MGGSRNTARLLLIILLVAAFSFTALAQLPPWPDPGHPAWRVGGGTFNGSYGDFIFPGTVNTSVLGSLGVGTTTPSAKLDVQSTSGQGAATIGGSTNAATDSYAVAMGGGTTASGTTSTAMGSGTTASGESSTAMGAGTVASGVMTVAMGYMTHAYGPYSLAAGQYTNASGYYSFAIGDDTKASGDESAAMGLETIASGNAALAIGNKTNATGGSSFSAGFMTRASGEYSTAIGYQTKASGRASTAVGFNTEASGTFSTAMGRDTTASGYASTATGYLSESPGSYSISLGRNTNSSSSHSIAMGTNIKTDSLYSIGIGLDYNKYYTITESGIMAIMGGNVGIGTMSPSRGLSIGTEDPFKVGDYTSGYLEGAWGVHAVGKYVYVVSRNNGSLTIFDVSNQSNPELMSATDISSCAPRSVFVSGAHAYMTCTNDIFQIYDVSDPSNPTAFDGLYSTDLGYAVDVHVSGKYAYVASHDEGLVVVDIAGEIFNGRNPYIVGKNDDEISSASSVYVLGKYAYVTDFDLNRSLAIIDISDPTDPTLAGSYSNPEFLNHHMDVYVSGGYAYVASPANNSLVIIDVSDVSNPTFVSNYTSSDILDYANGIYVSGKYAYLTGAGSDEFSVFDVSDPNNPTFIESYSGVDLNTPRNVFVSGKYAYVTADDSQSLVVFELGGLDAPNSEIGDLRVSNVNVVNDAHVTNDLHVSNGLNVGPGGIFVEKGAGIHVGGNMSADNLNLKGEITVGLPLSYSDLNATIFLDVGGTRWYLTVYDMLYDQLEIGTDSGKKFTIYTTGVTKYEPTDSPNSCSASLEGGVYYDNSLSEPCFCDGSNWQQFDGGGTC